MEKKHRFKVQTVEVMKIKILHFFCWSAHMLVNTFNAISLVFGSVFYFLLSLSLFHPLFYISISFVRCLSSNPLCDFSSE